MPISANLRVSASSKAAERAKAHPPLRQFHLGIRARQARENATASLLLAVVSFAPGVGGYYMKSPP